MGIMKDYDRRIRQGGDDAIAALSEYVAAIEPRWIPVGERLPDLAEGPDDDDPHGYRWVLCSYKEGVSEAMFVRDADGDSWIVPDFGAVNPTHWMPLPEPPR